MLPPHKSFSIQQAAGRRKAARFADVLSLRKQFLQAFLLAVNVKPFRIDTGRAEQTLHIGNGIQI